MLLSHYFKHFFQVFTIDEFGNSENQGIVQVRIEIKKKNTKNAANSDVNKENFSFTPFALMEGAQYKEKDKWGTCHS